MTDELRVLDVAKQVAGLLAAGADQGQVEQRIAGALSALVSGGEVWPYIHTHNGVDYVPRIDAEARIGEVKEKLRQWTSGELPRGGKAPP